MRQNGEAAPLMQSEGIQQQTSDLENQESEARNRLYLDAQPERAPGKQAGLQSLSGREKPFSGSQQTDSEPIARGHELVDYMETQFNNVSKDKSQLTRDDLKEFASKDDRSDKERQYLSFLHDHFNDIANLVPDSGEPQPYSTFDLKNPRVLNQMSLDDIRALNVLDRKFLHDFTSQHQTNTAAGALKFCMTAVSDGALTGLGTGAIVGGVVTAWSGPGVVGGIFGGAWVGWGLGGIVGTGVCAVGAPIKSYYNHSYNNKVENWFPEKQNVVRKLLSQPGF